MQSSTQLVLGIPEILECILLGLDSIHEIIRAQRVCRAWQDLVQNSPALQGACWFTLDGRGALSGQQPEVVRKWTMNPVFNRLGVSLVVEKKDPSLEAREYGCFNLRKNLYDRPGSWATMPATQPPCRVMEISWPNEEFDNEGIYYIIKSMTECLLVGDVIAAVAECQNRLDWGIDCWNSREFFECCLQPLIKEETSWTEPSPTDVLERMEDDVSIKVVIGNVWRSVTYPAFSLRRRDTRDGRFLHEMILHEMAYKSSERVDAPKYEVPGRLVCEGGEYKANLLAVKEYQEGYLEGCSHTFRLLSDI